MEPYVYSLFRQASYVWQYPVKVPPCLLMASKPHLSLLLTILYHLDEPQFTYPSPSEGHNAGFQILATLNKTTYKNLCAIFGVNITFLTHLVKHRGA